jgi:hypothetical protein
VNYEKFATQNENKETAELLGQSVLVGKEGYIHDVVRDIATFFHFIII